MKVLTLIAFTFLPLQVIAKKPNIIVILADDMGVDSVAAIAKIYQFGG